MRGLREAIAHTSGKGPVRLHFVKVPNVKAICERLDMSQREFATAYRIPLTTLQGWEQGRRRPDAPASAYLLAFARIPDDLLLCEPLPLHSSVLPWGRTLVPSGGSSQGQVRHHHLSLIPVARSRYCFANIPRRSVKPRKKHAVAIKKADNMARSRIVISRTIAVVSSRFGRWLDALGCFAATAPRS